ncbi:MAG: precorrin-8X methylmutase [Armatimonadota bacterium]
MISKLDAPLMNGFLKAPMSGPEIEARSFEIIDSEAPSHHFSPDQWEVVRRMIHTVGDFSIMKDITFSSDAIDMAVEALSASRPIYVDSNMIRSGLSIARLRSVNQGYGADSIHCHVADVDVAENAMKNSLPRSLFGVRKARSILNGGIAVFGNAPVALLELNRLIIEEQIRPALIIGMPVGFVHVVESKQELALLGIPFIALEGHRGGSPLAVSVVHALCSVASRENG